MCPSCIRDVSRGNKNDELKWTLANFKSLQLLFYKNRKFRESIAVNVSDEISLQLSTLKYLYTFRKWIYASRKNYL